jgi:hypothetical protein
MTKSKNDNYVERDRVLKLTVEVPYYGKKIHGEHLEETVRNELNLQFGKNVNVKRRVR